MFTRLHNRKNFFFLHHFLVILLLLIFTGTSSWADSPIKVACVGDSITAGYGLINPDQDSYPSRLALLLGQGWEVRNFGLSSATAMENGNLPYVKQRVFQDALAYKPDVIFIGLGSNDTKPVNSPLLTREFEASYRALIASFRKVNPSVRIYAFLPSPVFPEAFGVRDSVLTAQVIPFIRKVATQAGIPTIDMHSALAGKSYCFPDRLHPNEDGALRIARTVYQEFTGKPAPPIRKPTQGVTIMPMGDSVTVGATDPLTNGGGSGYRDQLYARLKQNGINFQFVGSAITGASATLRAAGQDFHEGHRAYKLSDLLNNVDANRSDAYGTSNGGYWFTGGQNTERDALFPNVVLLLAGTNDILSRTSAATVQARMTSLLDWFATNRPGTHLFVATLLPFDDVLRKTSGNNDRVRAFNKWLAQTISTRSSDHITLVDQYALFVDARGALKPQNSPDGIYLGDGFHPSERGYDAMGDAWFKAIRSFIADPEAPSLVVSSTDDVVDAFDDQTTLREAITYANTLGATGSEVPAISFDAQVFNGKRTITLNGTRLPEITTSLSIAGSRAGVTLDGASKSDILASSGPNVTLKALTFANGLEESVHNTAGTLLVEGCTFTGNAGAVGSKASETVGASLFLSNSTLSGNGRAVFSQGSSTVNLAHCTIAGNEVGLQNEGGEGRFNVTHTILTDNSEADSDFPLASNAFNIVGTDAGLDPDGLKNNGGPTDTIALLPGSPAVNAGDPHFDGANKTDGRGAGFARLRSGRIDIGAFEVQNLAPVARDEAYSTLEDTLLTLSFEKGILANDFDPDGRETLRVRLLTAPQQGRLALAATGAFTYSPALNWSGTDSFTYLVSDGTLSAQATATITVTPVNDAPTGKVSLAPASPTTNAILQATAVGSDIEGAPVSFTYTWKKGDIVLRGANGPTLDLSKLGYGDKGDKITVTATPHDGQVNGTPATATVVIANTTPSLTGTTFQGSENRVLTSRLAAQDPDQEVLGYSVLRAPRNGTLLLQSNGIFTYTPGLNWNGTDNFTARVVDGSGASVGATFTISIAPTNGVPTAANDTLKGTEDTPLSILAATLLRNDWNGENGEETDNLRIVKVTVPPGFPGKLQLDTLKQTLLFIPALNWHGTTSFSYTVQDSGQLTATAQVALQILPINDAPVATGGSLSVLSGTWGELLLQGSDVEGDALTFALASRPTNGVAQVVKAGDQWLLRYQSKPGFTGTETISVIARDGALSSSPATITITVRPNSAPQLVSLLPNSGTFVAGSTVVFEQKVRDANGTAHLDAVALLIGNSPSTTTARGGAALWFDALSNQFTLTKDDGVATFAPATLGTILENTQVKATLGASDVIHDRSGTLTLRWRVTFKPGFVGTKSLWGRVEDLGSLAAGFTKHGDINLTGPTLSPRASSAPTS